jgi:RNA polymerase sigma-70 factor (ECF subfamily)
VDEVSEAIAKARSGDPSLLWHATDGLRPYLKAVVTGVLRQRLAGKVDASDVVQQGLLASVERFEQFRGRDAADFHAWVVAIVRNEARNLLRFWHQERRHVARENAPPSTDSRIDGQPLRMSIPVGLGGATPTPSQRVALREEASHLLAALDRLPAEHREVLTLRHFEGLSHAQIAARTGKSEEAVRQLWVRALRRLRGSFEASA